MITKLRAALQYPLSKNNKNGGIWIYNISDELQFSRTPMYEQYHEQADGYIVRNTLSIDLKFLACFQTLNLSRSIQW